MKQITWMCIVNACLVLFMTTGTDAAQNWATAFRRQTETLELGAGISAEIQRFEKNGESVSAKYASALASRLREMVLKRTAAQLENFQTGQCKDAVDVEFMKDGLALKEFPLQLGSVEKDFEKGFMRVETVACFSEITNSAAEALALYTSPEFRLSSSSTLKRIEEKEGRSCVETKGIPALLKATLYCNQVQNFWVDGMAIQHSQVTLNPEPDVYQNVFFKESLKSFVELPGGGLAFHYINYSRSDRMGGLKRSLGEKSVKSSQKKALKKLLQRLKEESGEFYSNPE